MNVYILLYGQAHKTEKYPVKSADFEVAATLERRLNEAVFTRLPRLSHNFRLTCVEKTGMCKLSFATSQWRVTQASHG